MFILSSLWNQKFPKSNLQHLPISNEKSYSPFSFLMHSPAVDASRSSKHNSSTLLAPTAPQNPKKSRTCFRPPKRFILAKEKRIALGVLFYHAV
jgi:hypothetical protein